MEETYVILRCRDAGVHAGYLSSRPTEDRRTYILRDARRIWYWDGAATLSELAVYGPDPDKRGRCKFGVKVPTQELRESDVSEVVHCQPEGQKAIEEQPEWRAW